MKEQAGRSLHLRGFISLLTALSFLIMTVSGIVLFITPQGRIAYWLDWRFLWLSKTQWGDMHITTSLLFALAGLWHTWLNWRALVSYFHDKVRKTVALKAELAVASVITVFFTIGAVYKVPPLNYLLDLNEFIKDSWIRMPEDEPVISHAELLPLKNFVQKADLELQPALDELKRNGIAVSSPEQKLLDIARTNNTSPSAIYKMLKKAVPQQKKEVPTSAATGSTEKEQQAAVTPLTRIEPAAPAVTGKKTAVAAPAVWTSDMVQKEFEGKGVGRKTLAAICAEYNLDQAVIIKKLAAKKITMAADDSLKKTGDSVGELPIEVLKVILIGEKRER